MTCDKWRKLRVLCSSALLFCSWLRFPRSANGFTNNRSTKYRQPLLVRGSDCAPDSRSFKANTVASSLQDVHVAGKFKILTCSSTACTGQRRKLHLDDLSLFIDLFTRIDDSNACVQIEESPCLGHCKHAPCVGIQHDDFAGPVALQGMTEVEFGNRVFRNVQYDTDVDRVWSSVEEAVRIMGEEAADDDECK